MPKASTEPDPNRRQTRSKNAFAHPGRVVLEALAVRRRPEEIENEKKARNQRQKAKAKKNAHKKVAIKDIAQFELQMALDNKAEEASFPRHKSEGGLTRAKARLCTHSPSKNGSVEAEDKRHEPQDQSTRAANVAAPSQGQKRKKKVVQPLENDGVDTEPEDTELARNHHYSKLKKQKITEVDSDDAMPLCRTGKHLFDV